MGTGFKVLVILHVLCVIGGFGAVAYNGLYLSLAQQRPEGGTSAVLEINRLVSGMAEILIYAALLFGIGAVAASHSDIKFSDAWVSAALGVYLAVIGVMHGWIRPNQRRHAVVVRRLETPSDRVGAAADDTRHGDVTLLKSLERKVGFGWGAFNLLVIGAVYLMVFQPGG
jgi:uncharacterized membrane protein